MKFFCIIIFLLLITNSRVNYQNLFCNHNLYLDFIRHDLDKAKQNYVFMSDTIEGYKGFMLDALQIYLPVNHGIKTVDLEQYGIKKPCICYVLNLYLSDKTLNEARSVELYKTPLGVFTRVEF